MSCQLLLNALQCKNKGRPPVWLMRQAGRYMPSYQALRSKHRLIEMFHEVDLIVKVTKMPLEQLGVDAAILFSDILTLCDGFGLSWDFEPGVGPLIKTSPHELATLQKREAEEAYPQIRLAIQTLKKELKVPLIGFAGAPFTVASYLVERRSSRDLSHTKKWIYSDPTSFHALLAKITQATLEYLALQIDAGVDAVQIFDSWAGMLTPEAFEAYASQYVGQIVEALKKRGVPIILFSKGSARFADLKPNALSVDWSFDLVDLRKKIDPEIALQGNLDPCVLLGSREIIKKEVSTLLTHMKDEPGYIFNLGHGILPHIPLDNVKTLVELVKTC